MGHRRGKHRAGRARRDPRLRRLRVEQLEDRRMFAVATVTTHLDVIDFTDGVTSLREAIFAANTLSGADTILFDASLDGAAINLDLALGELAITDSLTIDASNLPDGLTIDAGDGLDGIFGTGDGIRIFNIDDGQGSAVDVEIVGLTLVGGDIGGGFAGRGGAIRSQENLTVTSCTISGNASQYTGGGIDTSRALLVQGSVISGNRSADRGGGFNATWTVTLLNSVVSSNSTFGNSGVGGGIFAGRNLTITNTAVSDNWTEGDSAHGGGIYAGSDAVVVSSIIRGNVTQGSSSAGGGIYAGNLNSLSFTSCSVIGNHSQDGGGGIRAHEVNVTDSLIEGNTANAAGGAGGGVSGTYVSLWRTAVSGNSANFGGGVEGYSITVENCTVTDNSSDGDGGGIGSEGMVEIRHSTITNNLVTGDDNGTGGGIYLLGSALTISNSIVAGNAASSFGDDIYTSGVGSIQIAFSLVGDTTGSQITPTTGPGNLLNVDALLGPLANNGGPTLTHALLPGSPAINGGDPTFDPNDPDGDPLTNDAIPYDQRGPIYARVYGGRIDMGAFEVQPQHADFDNDGDVDGLDFLAWQIGFGTPAPNAAKADGDADNDLDVDADDLAVWENTYGAGGAAPLAALHEPTALAAGDSFATRTSAPPDASAFGSQAASPIVLALNAQLVDLALTSDDEDEQAELLEDEFTPLEPRAQAITSLAAPPRPVADFGDIAASRPHDDDASAIDASLEDELIFAAL